MGAPNHKFFLTMLVGALSLPFVGAVSYNLAIDPFEIMHKSKERQAAFLAISGLDRYTQAGIIRNYRPNAIVIGHSHAANFLPSHVDFRLGFRNTYNLTLIGGTLFEQGAVAGHALANGGIENVLWLFSTANFVVNPTATHHEIPFPHFLYDSDVLNDLGFFMTLPMKEYAKKKALKRKELVELSKKEKRRVDPRDHATAWHWRDKGKFNRPVHIVRKILGERTRLTKSAGQLRLGCMFQSSQVSLWPRYTQRVEEFRQETPLSKHDIALLAGRATLHQENFERNILPVIRANPSTQFRFVIDPPFPMLILQVCKIFYREHYDRHLGIIARLVSELAKYPNVEVYGFGGEPVTRDLRLYRDETHYHLKFNDMMLTKIAKAENRLTPDNVLDYLARFDALATQYKLPDEWSPRNVRGSRIAQRSPGKGKNRENGPHGFLARDGSDW
jgi:hypothetical protein